MILGNLLGVVIFKYDVDKSMFFIIMSVIALLACVSFFFVRTPYILSKPNYDFVLAKEDDIFTVDGSQYFKGSGLKSFRLGLSKSS